MRSRFTPIVVLAALAAGCGSGTPQVGAPGAAAYSDARIDAQPKQGTLLYLSDVNSNTVSIYSYPKLRLVGTLSDLGMPRAECADGAGNVWVSDEATASIVEYAHGSTEPTVSLDTPGRPGGCSVNPRNGDLAVTGGRNGTLLGVFHRSKHGRWRDAATYTDAAMTAANFCAYDADGNLFIDGTAKGGTFALAELPHKGKALQNLNVDQQIATPGGMIWDGSYLAVGDSGVTPSVIYQFSVSGSAAVVAGSTTLDGSKSVRQFAIAGSRLIGPDYGAPVSIWNYPAGGSPIKSIPAVAGYGAAVSVAPSAPPRR